MGAATLKKWDGNILWSLLANKYWLYFNVSFRFTVVRFVNQQVVFSPPLWRDVTVFRDVTFSVRIRCGRFTESSLSWSGKRWARTETQGTQGTFHTIASLNARLPVARVCIKQAKKWIIKLKRTRKTCSEFCHPYCGGKGGKTNMAVQYHLSEKPMVDGRSRVLSVCLCICRPVLQFSSYRCLRVFCVPIARLKCGFRHPPPRPKLSWFHGVFGEFDKILGWCSLWGISDPPVVTFTPDSIKKYDPISC